MDAGSLPFPRGKTYFDGGTTDTTSAKHLEGTEWDVEDIDLTAAGVKTLRSPHPVKLKIVRNLSGIALLPKRMVKYQLSGTFGTRVDGYVAVTAEAFAGVVDEFLASTGVPANDLFYIVVEGPSTVLTDIASLGANTIAVGDMIVALTAATTQATTAGRIYKQDLTTGTTGSALALQSHNRIGRAMSAATTGQTNAGILALIGKRW